MNCTKCGVAQSNDASFCSACGAALRAVPVAPTAAGQPKPKRGLGAVLTGIAALALLGIGALILWKGQANAKALGRATGETPKAAAPVPSTKGLTVLLNGLEAGSPPLADMKQFAAADDYGTMEFTRPNDKRVVLGVPVESVRYSYVRGKLLWVVTHRVTAANAAPLLAALKREYGEPQRTDSNGYHHWYEPKGAAKGFVIAAGYGVETSGEGGVYVMSGPVGKRLVDQATNAAATQDEPAREAREAASIDEQTLRTEIGTLAGDDNPSANIVIARRQNTQIEEIVITKNLKAGTLTVTFQTNGPTSPWSSMLIRLFDSNGAYLTHISTEELFRLNSRSVEEWGMKAARHAYKVTYQLPVRDLREATQAEFGFSGVDR